MSALWRTAILARQFAPPQIRNTSKILRHSATSAMSPSAAPHLGRLAPEETAVFICDVQERFRSAISGFDAVIDTSRRMARASEVMSLPVIVTEQYPKALGNTVSELAAVLPPGTIIADKTVFSMIVPRVEERLSELPHVRKILLVGIETHVCVLQTTLDLLERGYEVHILTDGVSSQRVGDRATALRRLSAAGAFLSTSEMVLFQMMVSTAYPGFKAISAICKEERPQQLPEV